VRFAVAALLVAACHPAAVPPPTKTSAPHGDEVRSNITRADYAGSQACRRCHPAIYADWDRSPMHNMTRVAKSATTHAPFGGEKFVFKDDSVEMSTQSGERMMRISSARRGVELYRVTRVIGGHHREDFVGVRADGPPGEERVLPASWLIDAGSWRYKGYSVMTPERPELRAGAVWRKTCIFCHNTSPYLLSLLGPLAGETHAAYQAIVVDTLLPPERRARVVTTDAALLAGAISVETARFGAHASTPAEAIRATRGGFSADHLVEVGIGCEACHGGSKEHTEHVGASPAYRPVSPFLRVEYPGDSDGKNRRARDINRICARCHQVLFSQYPHTWEGGARMAGRAGGSHINSGEARDFLLGGCAGQMACTACHDPHAPDNKMRMAKLDADAICLNCHQGQSGETHSHHKTAHCMDCHMPRKNMNLDNGLGRYHRIGSPTETSRVESDRPLECAICHADKSVRTLVDDMERLWSKKYDHEKIAQLYGGLDVNPLVETVRRGKPHEQASALGVLAEHPRAGSAPLIGAQLVHRVPIVRYFAVQALAAALGKPVSIDLFTSDEKIAAEVQKLVGTAPPTAAPIAPGSDDD
jgi:predicted CXXCH cytochrome family protein